jgi:aminocarboxymuconate-semialdehyde decarboxylase
MSNSKKFKTIDVHAHISVAKPAEAIKEEYTKFVEQMVRGAEKRVRDMDNLGVDMQALSIANHIAPPFLDLSIDASHLYNDMIAEVVNAYPSRFVGLGTIPLQEPRSAADELERCMTQLNLRGVEIGTSVQGRNLDSPDLWSFYERAEKLDAFIFVHPTNVQGADRMPKYHLANLVGNPSATTLAAASLIFGGVLEAFPDLKFCLAHAGGFAPFQRGRFDHGYEVRPECKEKISKPPSEYFKLLYFDTVAHYEPALTYLIKSVDSKHVLLGSDYPADMADFHPVASVENLKTITNTDKRRVLGENAANLLKILS